MDHTSTEAGVVIVACSINVDAGYITRNASATEKMHIGVFYKIRYTNLSMCKLINTLLLCKPMKREKIESRCSRRGSPPRWHGPGETAQHLQSVSENKRHDKNVCSDNG